MLIGGACHGAHKYQLVYRTVAQDTRIRNWNRNEMITSYINSVPVSFVPNQESGARRSLHTFVNEEFDKELPPRGERHRGQ